jgi:hypothetical protein
MTHVERGNGPTEGRVLCYRSGGRVRIVWTDTPTKLLGEASAAASDWSALYAWWQNTVGPEKESAAMEGMKKELGHFPDAIEDELLLAHIPPAIRKTCTRHSVPRDSSVFLRAVECKQDGSGRPVIYEYAHSVTALRTFFVDRVTGAGLAPNARQSCATNSAAAGTWVRRNDIEHVQNDKHVATGRVLCHVGADGEEFEWSDWPLVMYAYAARPTSQHAALHDWWAMNAGPGPLESGMMGESSMS